RQRPLLDRLLDRLVQWARIPALLQKPVEPRSIHIRKQVTHTAGLKFALLSALLERNSCQSGNISITRTIYNIPAGDERMSRFVDDNDAFYRPSVLGQYNIVYKGVKQRRNAAFQNGIVIDAL